MDGEGKLAVEWMDGCFQGHGGLTQHAGLDNFFSANQRQFLCLNCPRSN